jgi:4-carboxymuconolactone decarboxylase
MPERDAGLDTIPAIGREPALDAATLSAAQREAAQALAGDRGALPAPYRFLVHSPDVLELVGALGTRLRSRGELSPREYELVILITGRHFECEYVQQAHRRIGLAAGLSAGEIEDILQGRFEPASRREAVLLALTRALHESPRVADDVVESARRVLGNKAVAEVIGYIGVYTVTCYTMRYTGA